MYRLSEHPSGQREWPADLGYQEARCRCVSVTACMLFFTSAWKRWVPLYTYTTFIPCAGPIIWSEMWMISADIWLQFCFVLSNHLLLRICNSTRRKVTRANSFLSATILLNVLTDLLQKIYTDRFASKYTIILFLLTVRNTANTS